MSTRKLLVVTAAVVIGTLLATASVAGAVYLGLKSTVTNGATQTVGTSQQAPTVSVARATDSATAAQGSAGNSSLFVGGGPFEPGQPPSQGLSGDGIIVSGVAFKETADANAQPDSDLIKSAYQDAQKKADALASATGLKLGSLLAVTDSSQNQPYYKPCVAPGVPVPGAPGTTGAPTKGSGSGGGTTSSGPAIVEPAPCNSSRYLVVWVTVRYQVG